MAMASTPRIFLRISKQKEGSPSAGEIHKTHRYTFYHIKGKNSGFPSYEHRIIHHGDRVCDVVGDGERKGRLA